MTRPLVAAAALLGLTGCPTGTSKPVAVGTPPMTATSVPDGPRAESPLYTRWAKFKPGTTVVYKDTTERPGQPVAEQVTTYRLKSLTDDLAVVESVVAFREADGKLATNPAQEYKHNRWFTLRPEAKIEDYDRPQGTVESKNEVVKMLDRDVPTRFYRTKGHVDAGETESRIWQSEEVPGGLVKSVTLVIPTQRMSTTEVSEITLGK